MAQRQIPRTVAVGCGHTKSSEPGAKTPAKCRRAVAGRVHLSRHSGTLSATKAYFAPKSAKSANCFECMAYGIVKNRVILRAWSARAFCARHGGSHWSLVGQHLRPELPIPPMFRTKSPARRPRLMQACASETLIPNSCASRAYVQRCSPQATSLRATRKSWGLSSIYIQYS